MPNLNDPLQKEYADIAQSVRTGEYFRKARAMYDFSVHNPMAERYLYILITLLALLIFYFAFSAASALYPLQTPVPFIFSLNNVVDDLPRMRALTDYKGEDPNAALIRFFARNYVQMREEYNINSFERDANGTVSQSAPAVAKEFQQQVDRSNPESPVVVYQRYSTRKIAIVSLQQTAPDQIDVVYDATVEGKGEVKKTRWQAHIVFTYNGLVIDKTPVKASPVFFLVTQYRTKRLG